MSELSIGELAHASGLTVRAIRHYEQLGLLLPAAVHPSSGYRRYGPGQLERAQLIARLRGLGIPLARIGDYLAASSPQAASSSCNSTARPWSGSLPRPAYC